MISGVCCAAANRHRQQRARRGHRQSTWLSIVKPRLGNRLPRSRPRQTRLSSREDLAERSSHRAEYQEISRLLTGVSSGGPDSSKRIGIPGLARRHRSIGHPETVGSGIRARARALQACDQNSGDSARKIIDNPRAVRNERNTPAGERGSQAGHSASPK